MYIGIDSLKARGKPPARLNVVVRTVRPATRSALDAIASFATRGARGHSAIRRFESSSRNSSANTIGSGSSTTATAASEMSPENRRPGTKLAKIPRTPSRTQSPSISPRRRASRTAKTSSRRARTDRRPDATEMGTRSARKLLEVRRPSESFMTTVPFGPERHHEPIRHVTIVMQNFSRRIAHLAQDIRDAREYFVARC